MEEQLGVPRIASELGVSQRQLERLFRGHVGRTVALFGLLIRMRNARVLPISTSLSVRMFATACGFNSLPHFVRRSGNPWGAARRSAAKPGRPTNRQRPRPLIP